MKLLYLTPLLLAACTSSPKYKSQELVMDRQVYAMSRNEIINAVQECEGNGLRASMIYSKRMINGHSADIVVDVMCAPKFRFY